MKKDKKTPVKKIAHIKLVLGDFACRVKCVCVHYINYGVNHSYAYQSCYHMAAIGFSQKSSNELTISQVNLINSWVVFFKG